MRCKESKLRHGAVRRTVPMLVVAVTLSAGALGQISPPPFGPPDNGYGEPHRDDPRERQQEEKMAKARNELRQQNLEKDTAKLLTLATELKAEVDKSNKDVLSVDVVKKAEEIEKLARSVKDKMRQ